MGERSGRRRIRRDKRERGGDNRNRKSEDTGGEGLYNLYKTSPEVSAIYEDIVSLISILLNMFTWMTVPSGKFFNGFSHPIVWYSVQRSGHRPASPTQIYRRARASASDRIGI